MKRKRLLIHQINDDDVILAQEIYGNPKQFICRVHHVTKAGSVAAGYINLHDRYFHGETEYFSPRFYEFFTATEDEISWMDACEGTGLFVNNPGYIPKPTLETYSIF